MQSFGPIGSISQQEFCVFAVQPSCCVGSSCTTDCAGGGAPNVSQHCLCELARLNLQAWVCFLTSKVASNGPPQSCANDPRKESPEFFAAVAETGPSPTFGTCVEEGLGRSTAQSSQSLLICFMCFICWLCAPAGRPLRWVRGVCPQ